MCNANKLGHWNEFFIAACMSFFLFFSFHLCDEREYEILICVHLYTNGVCCMALPTFVCITGIYTYTQKQRLMAGRTRIHTRNSNVICLFFASLHCVSPLLVFVFAFHIFALYDISIFHLCNFIIRAHCVCVFPFIRHEEWQTVATNKQSSERVWMSHSVRRREDKWQQRNVFENATHTFILLNRQSSSVWIFRISMLYLHAFIPCSFFLFAIPSPLCSIGIYAVHWKRLLVGTHAKNVHNEFFDSGEHFY